MTWFVEVVLVSTVLIAGKWLRSKFYKEYSKSLHTVDFKKTWQTHLQVPEQDHH